MLFNLILVGLVFGASKKRYNPYLAALVVGVIKGGIAFALLRSPLAAALGFLLYGGIAAAMVYLLARISRKEDTEPAYSDFSPKRKSAFKWEYIPLSAIVGFLIFGDMLLTLAMSSEAAG